MCSELNEALTVLPEYPRFHRRIFIASIHQNWVEIASTTQVGTTAELIPQLSLRLGQRLGQWTFSEPPKRKDLAHF
jgi:hypothetical protein